MCFTIQKAGPADIAFLRNCAEEAYATYVVRIGRRPAPMVADFDGHVRSGQVDLLKLQGQPVGYAVWFMKDDHLFIENMAIQPQHHGKGGARFLMDHMESVGRERAAQAIELYTNIKMSENLTLYPYLGFSEIGRKTEDGFDRVYFRKQLS